MGADEGKSSFEQVFDLEKVKENVYRGHMPWYPVLVNTFGGQFVAQAMMAAGRTLEGAHSDKLVNSVHGYFIHSGSLHKPIIYEVDRIRDGNNYSTRSVTAKQDGTSLFCCLVSFQREKESPMRHQVEMPADAPDKDDLIPCEEFASRATKFASQKQIAKILSYPAPEISCRDGLYPVKPLSVEQIARQGKYFYVKPAKALVSEDRLLHQCVVAYLSDFRLCFATLLHHQHLPRPRAASLDHSLWFHAPVKADGWLLHVMESPVSSSNRGLNLGRIFTEDGTLIASTAQEGTYRPSSKL